MSNTTIGKEEWYSRRDDRTKRNDGINNFETFSVGIIVFENPEGNLPLQIILVTIANILARWCRKIKIQVTDVPCCLPGKNTEALVAVLKNSMELADPFGEFDFGRVVKEDLSEIIVVGNSPSEFLFPHFWINANGWLAGVGYCRKQNSYTVQKDKNVCGPAFAACLGASELFKIANGARMEGEFETWHSLFDLRSAPTIEPLRNPIWPTNIDMGRILLVGCGAIGSSLAYILNFTDWRGKIELIDFDFVKVENCGCSLAFDFITASNGVKKTIICAEVLKGSQFEVTPFEGDYADYIKSKKYFDNPPDLVVCLANERNVWETIQHNFPPLVLHATTTPSWGMNFGRHIPKKDWCILCRFSKNVKTEFKPDCGHGEVGLDDNQQPVLGTLPFLSPASAVLLLGEVAKLFLEAASEKAPYNFIEFSMKPIKAKGQFMPNHRNPDVSCSCSSQKREIYAGIIGKTRFWSLTLT